MPLFESHNFGNIPYRPESLLSFPDGLPGFEERRSFLPVQGEDTDPLIFLQSLDDPSLCFVTLPALSIDPDYRLSIDDEDLEKLGLPPGRQPRIGKDVLCLVILSIREGGPTANMLAPVVINLRNCIAVQAVAVEGEYSHQHQLVVPEEAAVCS
jgi:flagellar assembly factor FliW